MEDYSIDIEREQIEYTVAYPYERDPEWKFLDSAGHAHDATLNTIEWVITSRYWCADCRDEHEEGVYRCRICGEVITPGRRYVGNGPFYRPGLLSGRLTVCSGFVDEIYVLRPDELKSLPATDGTPRDQWVAKVRERQPDDLRVAAMREP